MRRVLVLVLAGASLVAAGTAAGEARLRLVDFVRLEAPAFPPPVSHIDATPAVRLITESVTPREPTYVAPPETAPPIWAELVGNLVDARFAHAFTQPGTTFGVYGTGIIVGVGRRGGMKYAFDLRSFGFPPKTLVPSAYGPQEIIWGRQIGRLLVVQTSHLGYAKDSGNRNGYLTGIDINTGKVRWRSPSLVANARNFVVTRGLIVSGYGFTAEKDWLYIVDPRTGRVRDRLALPSMAEEIAVRGDRIVVRCYDAVVVAKLVGA
jgi:PQQ enzyme repeat